MHEPVTLHRQADRTPGTTFADQAVIAIENTRLFEGAAPAHARSAESLEQQTATSGVLSVISSSPTTCSRCSMPSSNGAASAPPRCRDPPGDGEASRSRRTTGPWLPISSACRSGAVWSRRDGHRNGAGARARLWREELNSRSARDSRCGSTTNRARLPLLRDGQAIGCHSCVDGGLPFTEKQIELLETFADQAVIAIENTRLFEEVQARNRDLTALGEVGRAVSSTLDLKVVLKTIVERAVHLSGTDAGSMFYYRAEVDRFELGETTGLDEEIVARFRKLDISAREGGLGEAIAKRQPLQIPDLSQRPREVLRDAVLEAGFRAVSYCPTAWGGRAARRTRSAPTPTGRILRRPSSASCRPSPTSRPSRWRTLVCSMRSPRRAASSRSRASTSRSSSPT